MAQEKCAECHQPLARGDRGHIVSFQGKLDIICRTCVAKTRHYRQDMPLDESDDNDRLLVFRATSVTSDGQRKLEPAFSLTPHGARTIPNTAKKLLGIKQ